MQGILFPKNEEEMSQERLSMRKIEEILRLKYEVGLSHRAIAQSCSASASTGSEYVTHAKAAGLVDRFGRNAQAGEDNLSQQVDVFLLDRRIRSLANSTVYARASFVSTLYT